MKSSPPTSRTCALDDLLSFVAPVSIRPFCMLFLQYLYPLLEIAYKLSLHCYIQNEIKKEEPDRRSWKQVVKWLQLWGEEWGQSWEPSRKWLSPPSQLGIKSVQLLWFWQAYIIMEKQSESLRVLIRLRWARNKCSASRLLSAHGAEHWFLFTSTASQTASGHWILGLHCPTGTAGNKAAVLLLGWKVNAP